MFSKLFTSVIVWNERKICDRSSDVYYECMNSEILKKRIIIFVIMTKSYRLIPHTEIDNSIAIVVYV